MLPLNTLDAIRLADPRPRAVDRLTKQVGVAGMAAVLLKQIAQQPAQTQLTSTGPFQMDELIEAAVGKSGVEPGATSCNRSVPQRVELRRRFVGGEREGPIAAAIPAHRVPWLPDGLAAQLRGEHVVLCRGEVLE